MTRSELSPVAFPAVSARFATVPPTAGCALLGGMHAKFSRVRSTLKSGWVALFHHDGVPGFVHLPWLTRRRLDVRALARFVASAECLHWLSALLIWWQCAALLVWTFDLRGGSAAVPFLAACLWAWPWMAAARRRHIAELLEHRWPE